MKKRKILLLIPFAGLILSGCSAQDGFGWIGQNIFTPIKDFFTGLFNPGGKQEEQKKEEGGGGKEEGKEEEVETVVGSIENPVSASEFCAKADELIDFSKIEVGKSETCKTTLFFVEGKVTSSKAMNQYGEIEFLNMVDTENNQVAIVGHFTVVDSSITEDYSEANSLQSKTVVVKGYACLFNHKDNGKTYQLAKKDNDNKPTVVKVTDGTPTPGVNYGTLENPLTTSEAWALIDNENPTNAEMYVGGTVVSNTAWSTQYNNIDIVITDGVKEFTIYRAGTLPSSYSKDNSEANDLLGYTIVAAGIGKIYTKGSTTTYELDQGCVVLSLEAPPAKQVASIVSTVGPEEVALNHVFTKSEVTVTVMFEGESEPGTAKVLSVSGETGTPGGPYTADVTIEGWNETLHFTYNVTSEESNYGSLANPLGVTEARTLIAADGGTSAKSMYVAGTVKSNKAWDDSHGNVDITITDGVNEFIVFRTATFPSGITKEDITINSLVGQVVVASGTGVIYNETTYEFQQGCVVEFLGSKNVVSFVSAEGPSGEYDQGATVHPEDVKVIVTFEGGFNGLGKVTAVNAPTTSSGTHTGQATVEGLNDPVEFEYTVSASSSTPLTIVAGENGSACTVNENEAIKVGTSKLGGSFTITVPAGAKSLELYAAAWNGASNLSLTITGATTDPSSIALTADSGISGNSPFTLAGSESSFKFTIGLSGITASTTLTFTTSSAKRCVAWSASYR